MASLFRFMSHENRSCGSAFERPLFLIIIRCALPKHNQSVHTISTQWTVWYTYSMLTALPVGFHESMSTYCCVCAYTRRRQTDRQAGRHQQPKAKRDWTNINFISLSPLLFKWNWSGCVAPDHHHHHHHLLWGWLLHQSPLSYDNTFLAASKHQVSKSEQLPTKPWL